MSSHIDSTYLCQLTAAQIQEILVLKGVLIQEYQPQLHRWLTIAQLPNLGQLTLSLEPEKAAEIDLRLHNREIVEFTATTIVMNIDIGDRYVFIPLLEQPDLSNGDRRQLWGRICLVGNLNGTWTSQDLSWVQALGQQLLTALNMFAEFTTSNVTGRGDSSTSEIVKLIERIAQIESLCHQKDDFINNISHDLRAPLMNIKMAVRLLKTSLNTDTEIAELLSGHRAEKYLAILEQECDREVELINKILELQRLELAIDPINLEPVEIQAWLQNAIAPFIHRVNTDRQQLVTTVSASISTIATDRFCLNKIFTELLNNACKYTQVAGQIHVEISGPNSDWLTIVVKNQTQISEQHLPHIFEQFYRIPRSEGFPAGDATLSSQQGGSGLGLSLVKKLVQQLNGQIHVASIEGWTEFTVKLPLNLPV